MATSTTDHRLTILENCRITPPPNTVGQRTIPLTFFDLPWLLLPPVHQLFFYNFPHPTSHFIQTIIPKLKHSLSITLQHFFPFAGNLILFPGLKKPEIRYGDGDSLPLTFAESHDLDFFYMKQNHARECNMFHPLVPLIGTPKKASDHVKFPVFSIQVTVFPNAGITIGLTNHHSLCDAKTRYGFLMAWTSVAKHGSDEVFLSSKWVPVYDRVIVLNESLDILILNLPPVRALDENYIAPRLVVTDKFRLTFVLKRLEINRLKKWVLVHFPELEYVSSFAVGCGFVWSCIAKSRVQIDGKKGEYEVERFACVMDWRARLVPAVPENYFGNCLALCGALTQTKLITGNEGFPNAVKLLVTAIREEVNQRVLFEETEAFLKKVFMEVPSIGVAGTPKLNVYDVDFGWGKPEKYETVSVEFNGSISVNAGKESSEDLEIGLCLPPKQMDAFITISKNELEKILSHDHFKS